MKLIYRGVGYDYNVLKASHRPIRRETPFHLQYRGMTYQVTANPETLKYLSKLGRAHCFIAAALTGSYHQLQQQASLPTFLQEFFKQCEVRSSSGASASL